MNKRETCSEECFKWLKFYGSEGIRIPKRKQVRHQLTKLKLKSQIYSGIKRLPFMVKKE